MILNESDTILLDKISEELEELYNRISPTEFDLRERVWEVWNQIMTIQMLNEDETNENRTT